MIRSMTGYGRADCEVEGTTFQVEMRAVNHRHLDLQLRLPRSLASFEPALRAQLRGRLARGKLEVSIGSPGGGASAPQLAIDRALAARYVAAVRELGAEHGLGARFDAATLLTLPGVTRLAELELPAERLEPALLEALERALEALLAMRRAEGEALEADLRARLDAVRALLEDLAGRAESLQRAVRERLRKRTAQLEQESGLLDEARLHQEIVLAADRMDVTEEIVRLRSHTDQFAAALSSASEGAAAADGVGRRLEFLLQEMLREANTIGSKAGDAPAAHRVVDLKTELERLREQALNVE